MPRIRSIKPEFFRSESNSQMPMRTRLTYIGLWTECDDHGRMRDNARLIKGAIWPLDDVSPKDIEIDLNTLADRGKIIRYEVDGRRYLSVTNWDDHQSASFRRGEAKYPGPDPGRVQESASCTPEDADRTPTSQDADELSGKSGHMDAVQEDASRTPTRAGAGSREQGAGSRAGARRSGRKRPSTPLPDDWKPTDSHVTKARELGVDGRREEEKFRAHAAANDRRQVDWNQAFTQWLLNARPGNVRPIQNGPKPKPRDSPDGPFQYRQARPGEENRLR